MSCPFWILIGILLFRTVFRLNFSTSTIFHQSTEPSCILKGFCAFQISFVCEVMQNRTIRRVGKFASFTVFRSLNIFSILFMIRICVFFYVSEKFSCFFHSHGSSSLLFVYGAIMGYQIWCIRRSSFEISAGNAYCLIYWEYNRDRGTNRSLSKYDKIWSWRDFPFY